MGYPSLDLKFEVSGPSPSNSQVVMQQNSFQFDKNDHVGSSLADGVDMNLQVPNCFPEMLKRKSSEVRRENEMNEKLLMEFLKSE